MICENLKTLDYNAIIINEPIKNSVLQYNYFYNSTFSSKYVNYKKKSFDSTGSLSAYNQSGVGVFLAPNNT